ncbi:23S rRNA (adenine(2030)-N(6))-methyltransferase RlmJ [Rhizomicrobium electricum]|uniref:Ribosomal RNA large subunit methyltransferase J n=1 Tax=Rhizomicrobium electricum TaxID=480070 RepID=A0ABN1EEY2_9PROT|nr:23S rRNA (adenine(2030)-N(6))-methyltransferase RlmJ [Rhizomicrobium electricum]NIJ48687.1 23S rRNA (adenine2030-N6)-methyltransferase [Rhizomicrobium electricum]
MNYRHAFHAGNFADVVKHLALIAGLGHLRRKEAGFAVVDTHGGRGAYDLAATEAARTGEAAEGIGRLTDVKGGPAALTTYRELAGGAVYPGSPLIAAKLLRPQDRLVAVEMHPEDAAALRQTLRPYAKARVEEGDGYKRLVALVPPPERRGLILIDPPYEAPDEFRFAAQAVAAAYRRFATGIYLVWFPIKSASEANSFCGEVLACGAAKVLRIDVEKRGVAEGKLAAAGLAVINPPWQFDDEMRAALDIVLPCLDCLARFDWLAGKD